MVSIDITVAQVYNDVENGIKTALEQKYGTIQHIGDVIDVNSEKNKYREWNLQINDPYGTLTDCYIFNAVQGDRGIVGIYKNNTLIWDSGLMACYRHITDKILLTADLNNNGNVEILSGWYVGMRNSIANIWIISWDGTNGEIINKIYETENWLPLNQESEIYSYDYLLDIIDIEGDGIYEIKGTDVPNTDQSKIYSWNGSNYGDYGVTMPDYVPMSLLTAKVSCKVSKSQYGLLYNYTVRNDSTSRQDIWLFAVDRYSENTFINSGTPNNKWSQRYPDEPIKLIQWDVSEDLEDFPFDYIVPGMERTNYREETDAKTITISYFYIQGKNGKKLYDNDYIQINSFKGKTICGKPVPDTLIYTDFLDTLIIYADSSYALGWIKDEQTRDKYDNYFNTAKTYLEQNNNNAAKSELQKVLTDCNTDSSNVLTSEAYALLYFNTDYLIKQIPEGEPGLPVKLEDSQGNLLPVPSGDGGNVKYYASGWKDLGATINGEVDMHLQHYEYNY